MKNIPRFQAQSLSDDESRSQFVVRKKEFELVMSDIRTDKMEGSIQHYIYVGQRGSGKSTLLRRIQAEINTDKALSGHLVAVNLSEEQAGIYRLHDLWFKVNEALIHNGFDITQPDWQQYNTDYTAYARDLYLAMQQALKKQGKKLVLLLDNIDRVLGHIKTADNHLFRELLMNYKDVRIVGGSTRLSEHYWKYDQPFYQFFRIIRLEPLTQSEMEELLSSWSDSLDEPELKNIIRRDKGKLNTIRVLSDGMPRTMLNLLKLLVLKPNEQGYEYLEEIMDDATPIYQERLGALSDLHQKVLCELSFFWDAADVKHLSEASRMESALLSSVLNQLVKLKIVDKRKGRGKNYYYLVHERFFNLWLIMTQGGPKEKSELRAMTVFLEVIYDEDELRQYAKRFMEDLSAGFITSDKAIIQVKGLVHSKYITTEQRDELKDNIGNVAEDRAEYIRLLPPRAKEIYSRAQELINSREYDQAIKTLNSIEQPDLKKYHLLSYAYYFKGDLPQTEKYLLEAISKGEKFNTPAMLASIYEELKMPDKAKKYNLIAVQNGNGNAMYNIANIYRQEGNLDEAIKFHLQAAEKGQIKSLNNLGEIYFEKKLLGKAEEYFLRGAEKGNVNAMYNLGVLYDSYKNNTQEAEKYLLMASEKGYGLASYRIGNIYHEQGKIENAEKYYSRAIKEGNNEALYNAAALLYATNKDKVRAIQYLSEYKDKTELSLEELIFDKVVSVWGGSPESLSDASDLISQAVEKQDTKVVERFIANALIHHQKNTVWQWFNDKEFAEKLREMLKPMYFVTGRLLSTGEAKEVMLTQPPELNEPVDLIYQQILERQKFYYGKAG